MSRTSSFSGTTTGRTSSSSSFSSNNCPSGYYNGWFTLNNTDDLIQACFKGMRPQEQLSEEAKWGLIGAFGIVLPILIILCCCISCCNNNDQILTGRRDCCPRNPPIRADREQGAAVVPVPIIQQELSIGSLSEMARADAEEDKLTNLLKDEILAIRESKGGHPFQLQEWALANNKIQLYNWLRFMTPETIKQHQRERFDIRIPIST